MRGTDYELDLDNKDYKRHQKEAKVSNSAFSGVLASSLLTSEDVWFSRNLEALLGGEIALVNASKQAKINRKKLAEWIERNL
jgi:hypothetical protein